MDLDLETVWIALRTCQGGALPVMIDTTPSTMVRDFLDALRQRLKIREGERLRLTFGCKTLQEDQTRGAKGLQGNETMYLMMCLARGMQGAHISSLISGSGEGQKEDKEMEL